MLFRSRLVRLRARLARSNNMLGKGLLALLSRDRTFGGRMFRTVPLSFTEWLAIIGATSIVLWVSEMWRKLKPKAQTTNPA